MSFKVQLGTDGAISFANNALLEATNKPWVAFSILGADLKAALTLTGTQTASIVTVGNTSLSGIKFSLQGYGGVGTPVLRIVDTAFNLWVLSPDSAFVISSLSDSAYYDCAVIMNDAANAGNPVWFGVYSAGGLFTGPGFLGSYSNSGTPTVSTAADTGHVFLGNVTGTALPGGAVGQQRTFDFAKAGNDSSVSYFTANLEEGTGTSVSPSGTISGTYSWLGGAAPDHGIVTITPNTALNGSGATPVATVDWKDAGGTSLVPQPSTAWTVDSDSDAVTIDASGNITLHYPGTATVRATSGSVSASADITVRPDRVFSLTATIV